MQLYYVFAGVGCAMITVSLIVCIYYNVIMSYTVFYMVASFDSEVPWSKCDPAWADMATCYVRGEPQNLVSCFHLYYLNTLKNKGLMFNNAILKSIVFLLFIITEKKLLSNS